MNWFFIRHGQINSNLNKVYSGRSDEPLNAKGLEQAYQAIDLVKSSAIDRVISSPLARTGQTATIDRVISSPLARTGQTATILASANNLKVTFDPAFNEMKFGAWEGKSESLIQQQYPLEWKLWNSSPHQLKLPGRETLQQLQQRVIERMHSISALNGSSGTALRISLNCPVEKRFSNCSDELLSECTVSLQRVRLRIF